jgi:hypothetical protein
MTHRANIKALLNDGTEFIRNVDVEVSRHSGHFSLDEASAQLVNPDQSYALELDDGVKKTIKIARLAEGSQIAGFTVYFDIVRRRCPCFDSRFVGCVIRKYLTIWFASLSRTVVSE